MISKEQKTFFLSNVGRVLSSTFQPAQIKSIPVQLYAQRLMLLITQQTKIGCEIYDSRDKRRINKKMKDEIEALDGFPFGIGNEISNLRDK